MECAARNKTSGWPSGRLSFFLLLVFLFFAPQNHVWGFSGEAFPEVGKTVVQSPMSIGENFDETGYDASGCTVAPKRCTTVIGHLPDYPKVAEKMGANYLKPSANWNFQKQGQFIKDVISSGDDVFIGTKIRQGPSVLKKEIKQLIKGGYKPKDIGSKWLIKE